MARKLTGRYIESPRSKYNNVKTRAGGVVFDSRAEAARYMELKIMEKAGLIRNLERQVKFELTPAVRIGKKLLRASHYIADFVYDEMTEDGWKRVVEDVKGVRTARFILAEKILAWRYKILIREV